MLTKEIVRAINEMKEREKENEIIKDIREKIDTFEFLCLREVRIKKSG